MKKFLVIFSLIIFVYVGLGTNISFSADRTQTAIIKDIILKKRELEKSSSKGGLYVKALDAYFEKYQNDTKKIINIVSKVSLAKSKLGNTKEEEEIKMLIEYIEYKAELLGVDTPTNNSNGVIYTKNSTDFLKLNGDDFVEYIESLSIQQMEDITIELYKGNNEVYKAAIELYQIQIQKARDTTRIYDLKAIQSGIEQIYQDTAEYPTKENLLSLLSIYVPNIPKDNLGGYNINNCNFGYKYEVGSWLGIENQTYRLSTCFENLDNIKDKASNKKDLGIDNLRYEIGYWKEDTIFTENFYINNISSWEIYKKPILNDIGNLSSLDDKSKEGLFYYLISLKYIEANPEKVQESLDAYSLDARNAKVSSDIRTLATITEITLTDGSLEREKILGKQISSFKEDIGTIRTGYFNFSGLKQNREDFLDPNKNEYLFAYVINNGKFFYQVLGYTEEGNNTIKAVIKGNYIQINTSSPVSLFMNSKTGTYIKNGEVFDSEIKIGYKQDNSETNSTQTTTEDSNEIKKITGVVTVELKNPHELAGETLNFEVTVEKITKASGNTISNTIEKNDKVEVHYIGKLKNGEKFDSSYDRNETLPFTAGVGMMISGFDSGVLGMRINETKTLTLLPEEAYGLETIQEEISLVELRSYIGSDFDIFVGAAISTAGGDAMVVNIDYD